MLLDVLDPRSALRLYDLSLRSGAYYLDRVPDVLDRSKRSRYIAVKDDGFELGVKPEPYFYVYSVSSLDPIQWALERDPMYGVDFITFERRYRFEEYSPKAVGFFNGRRWVFVKPRVCYKLIVERPEDVIRAREPFLTEEALKNGIYASGFNIKYVARVAWDVYAEILGYKPMWLDLEPPSELPIPKIPIHVFDIEVLPDGTFIISVLKHRLLDDVKRDDIQVIVCREGRECDELNYIFKGARVLYGHNILGFDLPHLLRRWFIPELVLASKLDGVRILSTHGTSFQIGASRSLLAVARRLKKQANITDEELEVKEKSGSILASGDIQKIIHYNVNDVVLTAKIANVILTFVYMVAVITGVPPGAVQDLPAGVLAEYLAYRILEYRGILPGFKPSGARMEGSKVLTPCSARADQATLFRYLLREVLGEGSGP